MVICIPKECTDNLLFRGLKCFFLPLLKKGMGQCCQSHLPNMDVLYQSQLVICPYTKLAHNLAVLLIALTVQRGAAHQAWGAATDLCEGPKTGIKGQD